MKGLQEIAEFDSKWRNIALKITKNKAHADDIVQEMYLKLADKEEEVNDYYVILTLESVFIDYHKKFGMPPSYESQEIEDYEFQSNEGIFEATDEEQQLLDKIDNLSYTQKELLAETYDRSIRQISKEYNISRMYVHRQIKKAVEEVLGEDLHLYSISSLKYLKTNK